MRIITPTQGNVTSVDSRAGILASSIRSQRDVGADAQRQPWLQIGAGTPTNGGHQVIDGVHLVFTEGTPTDGFPLFADERSHGFSTRVLHRGREE